MIKVTYLVHNPEWTQEEWETQNEREFIITKEMISQILNEYAPILNEGEYVDENNIWIDKYNGNDDEDDQT